MTTERVLILESIFIFARLNFFGGIIFTVFLSCQVILTPILSRISITLFTSSMCAMPWRVVVPLFKSEAQSRPTEPFLEKLVFIVPLNFLPPFTSKSMEFIDCIFLFFIVSSIVPRERIELSCCCQQ